MGLDLLFYLVFSLAVIQLMNTIVNLTLIKNVDNMVAEKRVDRYSIVIPCRNESANISKLLADLLIFVSADTEIIIVDDNSIDGTAQVARSFKDPRVKVVKVSNKPNNYIGKVWACHVGSQEATGNYIFFLDADIQVNTDIFSKVVCEMQKYGYELVSVFPKQRHSIVSTWSIVPIMDWGLHNSYPHIIQYLPFLERHFIKPSIGQFMVFESNAYKELGGHKNLTDIIAEDIALMYKAVQNNMATASYYAITDLQCEMYQSFRGAISGAARSLKGINEIIGNIGSLLYSIFGLTLHLGTFVLMFIDTRFISAFLLLLITSHIISIKLRDRSVLRQLFLPVYMSLQHLVMLKVTLFKTKIEWRGRTIGS